MGMPVQKLTAKQSLFVGEYLLDSNATQAAIRAGYSRKTATAIGNENLIKPYISAAIKAEQDKRAEQTEITFNKKLMLLWKVVNSAFEAKKYSVAIRAMPADALLAWHQSNIPNLNDKKI